MSLPTEKEIGGALEYLKTTDESYAKAKSYVKGLEHKKKVILAEAYLEATGTNGEREQKAQVDKGHREWIAIHEEAVLDMEILAAKRKRAELTIDVWRSLNANQRKGNI